MNTNEYPYFILPYIRELAATTDSERALELRRLIAANVGNQDALADLLGLNGCSLTDFYNELTPQTPGTEDTIEIFLERFGKEPESESAANNEEPIGVPAVDYATMLMMEGDESMAAGNPPADATTSAIDSFLAAVPPSVPRPKRKPAEPVEEPPALTESFAKIMIKNKNYQKALDIFRELNLKNLKKSIYFADQIRFIEKLILNENKKRAQL